MSTDLSTVRTAMRDFIDNSVIPAEPVLAAEDETAEERLTELKEEAKRRRLWALGHPEHLGGGGIDLMSFVHLNEIIGRSEWGQYAVGSVSMQDALMLDQFGSDEQRDRWLLPMVRGEIYPSVAL